MLCSHSVISFFFFKQKTAYEMRISDWSSDVCSSDLREAEQPRNMMRRLVVLAVAASLLGLLFVGATIYSLPDMTHAPGGSAAKTLATSGTMMFDEGPFPRWPYVLGMIALAPFLAGLV